MRWGRAAAAPRQRCLLKLPWHHTGTSVGKQHSARAPLSLANQGDTCILHCNATGGPEGGKQIPVCPWKGWLAKLRAHPALRAGGTPMQGTRRPSAPVAWAGPRSCGELRAADWSRGPAPDVLSSMMPYDAQWLWLGRAVHSGWRATKGQRWGISTGAAHNMLAHSQHAI
jgi:hypothetical protein